MRFEHISIFVDENIFDAYLVNRLIDHQSFNWGKNKSPMSVGHSTSKNVDRECLLPN